MALRESLQYTDMSGQKTIGPISEPFTKSQEALYINGRKLSRSMGGQVRDYELVASNPLYDTEFDTIQLTAAVVNDTDLVELVINDPEPPPEDLSGKLDDILTAVLGSWIWDKSSGIMTMMDTQGNEKFKFEVKDASDWASQERRQDLEV